MSRIHAALRRRVARRARKLCEYCRTFQDLTGHDFTIDHILPESLGGTGTFDNLCLCCFWCNNFKQARTEAHDSVTGQTISLFNPRSEKWEDHFRWDSTFSRIRGRTAMGRPTVKLLRLNRASLVQSRRIWVQHNLHPPA